MLFPTCQVMFLGLYVSCPVAFLSSSSSASSAGPQLQALDRSVPRRARTASPASEWCLPDLNCKCYRSQRSPPDPNSKLRIRVCPAGLDLQALDRRIRVFFARPQLQAFDRSVPGRTRTASPGSEWSLPDLNRKESPKICQIECQKECQKICQIECQKECQNICQKVCQNRCQVECQKGCQSIQMVCQKLCQNNGSGWGSLEESNLSLFFYN